MAYRRASRRVRMSKRSKRARSRRRGAARVSPAVQRYVARAISRPVEKKLKVEVNDPIAFNGAATVVGDIIPLLPIVQLGDTSYARDGRSILAKSARVTMTIRWSPLSTGGVNSESPLYATIWFVRDKQQKSFQALSDNGVTGVYPYTPFNVLTGTLNEPYQPLGNWAENGLPIDTRRFEVRRKRIKLSPDENQLSGLVGAPASGRSADGDSTIRRVVSFTKNFGKGKLLLYRTDAQNYPDNYNSYCFITYQAPSSISGYTSFTGTQLAVQITRSLKFQDA